MKQHTFSTLSWLGVFLLLLSVSCTDEHTPQRSATVDDTDLVETRLTFDVAALHTITGTRADNDGATDETSDGARLDTEEERRIHNIWVFQFDTQDSKLLITPRYYDVSGNTPTSEGLEVDVLLKPDVESVIYVVANTGDATWATVANSPTLEAVKSRSLPQPQYFPVETDKDDKDNEAATALSIPMEGGTGNITPQGGMTITVPVTRMYAKVEICIGEIPETIELTAVDLNRIPYYCQIGTLSEGDPETAVLYPQEKDKWTQYTFKPGEKDAEGHYTKKMVVYLPENLQGQQTDINENNPELKTNHAPDNAFRIDFIANYVDRFTGAVKEENRVYTVYPGGNNYNNYNIRRNYIYRVTLDIHTDIFKQDIPSSNCFVVKPGQLLSFLPYYRTESGGGYNIINYLNPDEESKRINNSTTDMTQNVRIIWQTEEAIGDNSKGDKVWIEPAPATDAANRKDLEFHRKIYVKTANRGNALIAAYNSSGEIIWSWHIWITENDPGNVSNAIVYNTYAWNEKSINTSIRVPGYAVMPCNLGALRYAPTNDPESKFDTYSMLYQWGRKDPFPPMRKTPKAAGYYNYDSDESNGHARIKVFDNSHTRITMTTSGAVEDNKPGELFFTILANEVGGTGDKYASLKYSINHPTAFIAAAHRLRTSNYNVSTNYINRGDWLLGGDECLWGAIERTEGMKVYKYPGVERRLWDNYGPNKSIFDPCPAGWRVPPGDIWLGFTNNGLNHGFDTNSQLVNCTETKNQVMDQNGYTLYMQSWHEGPTSFFPTQGSRLASGEPMHGGICGNYHNATTDSPISSKDSEGNQIDRVNILHLHSDGGAKVNIFEDQLLYYVKAVGGPVRCVRDHK